MSKQEKPSPVASTGDEGLAVQAIGNSLYRHTLRSGFETGPLAEKLIKDLKAEGWQITKRETPPTPSPQPNQGDKGCELLGWDRNEILGVTLTVDSVMGPSWESERNAAGAEMLIEEQRERIEALEKENAELLDLSQRSSVLQGRVDRYKKMVIDYRKERDELKAEVESLKDPAHCPVCQSCGEEGCCSPLRCKFPTGVEDAYKENRELLEEITERCERYEKGLRRLNGSEFEVEDHIADIANEALQE